jgi:RimJ/RimL family protein N-acetyltransferase
VGHFGDVDPVVPPTLDTERLLLRQVREEDLDAYARMMADPEVRRYLDGRVIGREEAWRELAAWLGHWQLRGYGLWAVELKATGDFVGRVGLYSPEGWPGLEVGRALTRQQWATATPPRLRAPPCTARIDTSAPTT